MSAKRREESSFLDEIRAHDAAVRAVIPELWIGAEPTFTRADSQHVAWLFEAQGDDKEDRALSLLRSLATRLGRSVRLSRVEGRAYAGEERPRFALAATWARENDDGAHVDDSALAVEPTPVPAIDTRTTAWLTVTPDPGVVEVNAAPCATLEEFFAQTCSVYAAAEDAGLSAQRHRYNGQICDSGGGGQLSLGGPSAERSPFFVNPTLLPALLRYANRHPSLSYAFAPACIGSAGQGPRPDEGVRERFDELSVALELLERRVDEGAPPSPEELWGALAPLLVDGSGNSHRAEINVEKLWSPHLGARGRLGVVELRSLAMPSTPERMTALAALFRALAARLARAPYREPLIDWGAALHDRFALPMLLSLDLHEVLADLDAHGVGLGARMRGELSRPVEPIVRTRFDDAELTISPAREFWPLLGDTASQEHAGARLVDASTERLEIVVRTSSTTRPGSLSVGGTRVPLVPLLASPGGRASEASYVAAVRYRAFVPAPGLHASLSANDPIRFVWTRGDRAIAVTLHAWRPDGGGYDGLPTSEPEAARRRKERVVIAPCPPEPTRDLDPVSPTVSDARFTVDLRRPRPL